MEIRIITAPIELGRETLAAVKGRTFKNIAELQNELWMLGRKHLAGLEDVSDIEDIFDRVEIKDLNEFFADLSYAYAFVVENYSTYVYIS